MIKPDKDQFCNFYSSHSRKETAAEFGIPLYTVSLIAAEYEVTKHTSISTLDSFLQKYTFNELIDYFQSHSSKDTKAHFNLSSNLYRSLQQKLHLSKSSEDREFQRQKTCIEKYGVNSFNKTIEGRQKCSESAIRAATKRLNTISEDPGYWNKLNTKKFNTKLEKYGDGNYNNREKFHNTCLDRFGAENFAGTKDHIVKSQQSRIKNSGSLEESYKLALEKQRATNLHLYGFEHPWMGGSPGRDKMMETMLTRYGTSQYSSTQEWRDKVIHTNESKFGIPWVCLQATGTNNSKPNLQFAQLLEDNGIEFTREFHSGRRSFDFKIGDTLIEINPSATHNSTWGVWGRDPLDKNYHIIKTKLARDNNFRCIHIWDWDDKNKIIKSLQPTSKIYARKCVLKCIPLDECNKFLIDYHFQGTCRGQEFRYGLYFNNELIQVMTFGKPRYNKNYEWELLRLCTKPGYAIIGGAEKLFTHFIRENNPTSIISYCDNSKFLGDVYCKLGFTELPSHIPSKHWYSAKCGGIHITDNLLRQRGFDQLFGTNYGKGTSNAQLMLEHNFVEIYDCGQSTYIWKQ